MSKHDASLNPFPIRNVDERWEVDLIDQGEVRNYVSCDTREDAEAIAASRTFNSMFELGQIRDADANKVLQCRDALAAYGLDSTKLYRRMNFLLEDIAKLGTQQSDSAE